MGKRILQVTHVFSMLYTFIDSVYWILYSSTKLEMDYTFSQVCSIANSAIELIMLAGFVVAFIESRNLLTLLPMCAFSLQKIYTILLPFIEAPDIGMAAYSSFQGVTNIISKVLFWAFLLSLMARHVVRREYWMVAVIVGIEILSFIADIVCLPLLDNVLPYYASGCWRIISLISSELVLAWRFMSVSTDTDE